jgi:DNA-binding Lrp family transcriptional regulator
VKTRKASNKVRRLDETDLAILTILQDNARTPNTEIGKTRHGSAISEARLRRST